jgi:hypothetical protein
MSNDSMLAAVRAAAQDVIPKADDDAAAPQPNKEDSMADAKKGPAALTAEQRDAFKAEIAAEVQSDFDAKLEAAKKQARTEGASAERERILAIEANALPGHEELVAKLKGDPSVSADAAAGRMLQAEREARERQAQGIKGVEQHTGNVAAAPTPAADTGQPKATTPDGWKAEWSNNEALQGEFATAEDYAAFKQAEASGKVRVLRKEAS